MIESAEEAKEILDQCQSMKCKDPKICRDAQAYLSALRGPEVTELVEAAKKVMQEGIEHNAERLESALAKIEEARK
jgi:hypothetical protein